MTGQATGRSGDGAQPATQQVDWQDFRDHLSTADKEGRRRWLFPKKPDGRWYRWRTRVSWLLLAVMFLGPFARIDGNPVLLFNIIERRFSILGRIFWPQDSVIFAVAMLLFLTSIIIFTTAFGRLWCGWTCPQTVLLELLFRKIEYAIEGDSSEQRALRAAPWKAKKIAKKAFKHALFFGLSFLIGNTLLSYIIGTDQLFQIVADDPRKHLTGLAFMVLFTLVFYAIFARFREQACTFICPYGRFQSTMIDENTMVVAYDHKRGEGRGHLRHEQSTEQRRAAGKGDCIDCHLCVAVCPTGIDIRDGTQMECVNCTACIDACDSVMSKIKRPSGLIRYASLNSIERGEHFKFTARLAGYLGVVCALAGLLAVLVFTRSDIETILLRAPGALFQKTDAGTIENLYTLKIINKSSHDIPVVLKLENLEGNLRVMGASNLVAASGKIAQTSVLVELAPTRLSEGKVALKIGVYSGAKRLETVKTVFIGPRVNLPTQ